MSSWLGFGLFASEGERVEGTLSTFCQNAEIAPDQITAVEFSGKHCLGEILERRRRPSFRLD